jgi:hypothetical protein
MESRQKVQILEGFVSNEDCDILDDAIAESLRGHKEYKGNRYWRRDLDHPEIIRITKKYDVLISETSNEFNDTFMTSAVYNFYSGKEFDEMYVHPDYPSEYGTLSAVIYPTDLSLYEGGEIYFPALNIDLRPNKGTVVVFPQTYMHGVRPVTSGERCSASFCWASKLGGEDADKVIPYPH